METLGPAASLKKIFCGATRRRTIEKYPWSVLLCGALAEAADPPRMLTQCVHPCQRTPEGGSGGWSFLIDSLIERYYFRRELAELSARDGLTRLGRRARLLIVVSAFVTDAGKYRQASV